MSRTWALLAVAVLVAPVASEAGVARAQPVEGTGPNISLDRAEVQVGEPVVVTLTGWQARSVTLSVCGNLAKRGSADCNLVASRAVGLARNGPTTRTQFVVPPPLGACPCVVRASSTAQDEVAVAVLRIGGVPVAPVIEPSTGPPIAVSVHARPAPRGFLAVARSALGGPTAYEVTVSVRNQSTEVLSGLSLAGSAGRSRDDDAVSFDIPSPGALAPGASWEHEARVTLPAPALGRFVWQVTASGAGPAVHAATSVRRVPIAFVVLMAILVVDVAAMVGRRISRRERRGLRTLSTTLSQPRLGGRTRPRELWPIT